MDNISFELPDGANYEEICGIAKRNDVCLSEFQRNCDAITVIQVAGSIVTLLQFFIQIKQLYGKHKTIEVSVTDDDETEEYTIDYLIKYLKHLIGKGD
ncbi:MAG: hypothetical protein IKH33_07850 [Bacteroidales bacterium]|nr:hypothetical protein [Bacteroidales bacterium]